MSKQKKEINNVLIVIASYSSFRFPLKEAFNSLGIRTQFFDNRKTTLFEKIFFGLAIAYPPLYSFATKLINRRLLKKVVLMKPDFVLVSKGENMLAETINKISKKAFIVNWYTDYFYNPKKIKKLLSAYNAFFTGDKKDVDKYRLEGHKNLYYLPYAGLRLKIKSKKRKYDIVFIGTYNKKREILFDKLNMFNFKIWGDKKWGSSKLKNNYVGKKANFKEMFQILKSSKIVVNNHQNRVLNMRVYESTSAGAFLLTDYTEELNDAYEDGKEVVVYKKEKDLISKVNYYLKHENLRKKIAMAGLNRTRKDHVYKKRLNLMFKTLNFSSPKK